jgi:ELWxxDGT repeat protein
MADVGGTLFYSDGYDLWRSDGTFNGTYQVAKIADNSSGQEQMAFTGALAAPLGDLLLFGMMTADGGRELRTAYVTPPAAPTGLTNSGPAPAAALAPAIDSPAAAATPSGVRLTWADNSANESGFVIERSDTPDFAVVSATFFVPANTVSYTDTTASAGDAYYYRVRAVNAAGASAPSNGITTPSATLLSADFLYDGPAQRLVLRFSADVAASLTVADLRLRNLTTGQDVPASQMTLVYDAVTRTATVTFAGGRLADGRYHLTLASGDVLGANGLALDGDANGTPGGDFGLDFFTLAGDANRDGVVNFSDLLTLAKNYNQTGVTLAQGDFNGDGVVNFIDLLTLAKAYNKALPPASAGPVGVAAVGTEAMPSLSAALAQPAATTPPALAAPATTAKVVTTTQPKAPTPKTPPKPAPKPAPPAPKPVAPVKEAASPAPRPTTFSTRKVTPPAGVRRK